jgi:hypothetical protein
MVLDPALDCARAAAEKFLTERHAQVIEICPG